MKCPTCQCDTLDPGLLVSTEANTVAFMGDVRPVTYQQTKLLNALHSRFAIVVTRERLRNVLFADRIDGGPLCADDVLKQQICYLRKKLAGWPFQITAHYGSGYALTRSVNPSAEVHAKAYPYAVRAA